MGLLRGHPRLQPSDEIDAKFAQAILQAIRGEHFRHPQVDAFRERRSVRGKVK